MEVIHMKFVEVKEVPKKAAYHKLKDDLDRFIQSGAKVARIDFHEGEYKSATVAASCLRIAIKRHGYNGIDVFQRGDKIYLENNM